MCSLHNQSLFQKELQEQFDQTLKNNYKDGLLHGERKVYYENGELEKAEQFKNGFNLSGTYH